jgi:LuxR family quorum sensing-dependent transcriptional regulator
MDFLSRAESATGLEDLRSAFKRALENFGVPNFSMVGMIAEHEGESRVPTVLLRRTDDGWAGHYWEKGHFNLDPAIHGAMTQPFPFSWSDIENGRLSKEVRDLFSEIRDAMPVDGGHVIPTHDEEGFSGFIALYHEDRELPIKVKAALKLMALYAMERAKELYKLRDIGAVMLLCPLSPRQRQMMSYVAEGKSDWDIAHILRLAQSTVNEHIEKAKDALGVRTRAQAVAICVRRGWIRLQ